MPQIAALFANDITRQIEEVIKVDQTAEDVVASEVDEYVVTDAIKRHFVEMFGGLSGHASQKPQRGHRDLGVRLLRLRQVVVREDCSASPIENRTVLGEPRLRPVPEADARSRSCPSS